MSSRLVMDVDDIVAMVGDDGNVLQAPEHMPYINNEQKKIEHEVKPNVVNDDIEEQMQRNVVILDQIDQRIGAQGDQMKIASYLTNVQHIQRLCAQQMLLLQNIHRLMDHFKHKLKLLSECEEVIDSIVNSVNIQKHIIEHVSQLSVQQQMVNLAKLRILAQFTEVIKAAVSKDVKVCLCLCIFFIYQSGLGLILRNNNNNI